MKILPVPILLSITMIAAMFTAGANAATFRGLGDLPGGLDFSGANSVSADGKWVIGASATGAGFEAFLWNAESGMISLGDLPGGSVSSGAWGISDDGSVVIGTSSTSSGLTAFRWTKETGMVGLGAIQEGGFSVAHDISADGSVVVGYGSSPQGQQAFRWTAAGGMVGLSDLPGGEFYSAAASVSSDGKSIAGVATSELGAEAFRWSEAEGIVGLGDLPGGDYFSGANGMSSDGSVIVGTDYPGLTGQAFRWSNNGGMVSLGQLPGAGLYSNSEAMDVSADGQVIVGIGGSASTGSDAFYWDVDQGLRSVHSLLVELGVDLAGWRLTESWGVSDDGSVVVGRGINPEGKREAWIVDLAATPNFLGDFDENGQLNETDFRLFAQQYGETGIDPGFATYDIHQDGQIGIADLAILQSVLADTSSGSPAQVPEPSAMVLLVLSLTILIIVRKVARKTVRRLGCA